MQPQEYKQPKSKEIVRKRVHPGKDARGENRNIKNILLWIKGFINLFVFVWPYLVPCLSLSDEYECIGGDDGQTKVDEDDRAF